MQHVNTHTHTHIYIYNSKTLGLAQSLYFGSKLSSSGTTNNNIIIISTFLMKAACCQNIDCAKPNGIELYSMCCGVMLLLLIIYIHIFMKINKVK